MVVLLISALWASLEFEQRLRNAENDRQGQTGQDVTGALQPGQPVIISNHGNWKTVHELADDGSFFCYAESTPVESDPANRGDRDPSLLVLYQRGAGPQHRIAYSAGPEFEQNDQALIALEGTTHTLFPLEDNLLFAFTDFIEADNQMLSAMQRGTQLLVELDRNGDVVARDRFSLIGVTAAARAARESCQ